MNVNTNFEVGIFVTCSTGGQIDIQKSSAYYRKSPFWGRYLKRKEGRKENEREEEKKSKREEEKKNKRGRRENERE